MARFRFKIVDSQGRRRSGILRADSLEIAESGLRSKLCQVEELTLLPDEGHAVEIGRLDSSFSQVDRIRHGLAAVMALVFVISLYTWVTRPKDVLAAPENHQAVAFKVKGKLVLQGGQLDPAEWTVYVVFPELPYEVAGRLESEDGGNFLYTVDLEGVDRPKKVVVDVDYEGYRWTLPDQLTMPSSGDVDLGTLAVAAPSASATKAQPLAKQTPIPSTGEPRVRGRRMTKENLKRAMQGRKQAKGSQNQ